VIRAYVGIGSNKGDPRAQVLGAFDALGTLPETHCAGRSPLYRSAPVGAPGQADFVNAVAALDTALSAPQLLEALQAIESAHGRERPYVNAPRTLDLDLLLYGDTILDSPQLKLPHPRMHERAFVLRPLLDLDARAEVPDRGAARTLLQACAGQALARLD
jgi:2-amino-4-hydroxy-6-hydroxymethyldihydropteridine diphosphokinase